MIAYKYKAISKDGALVTGVVNAYNEFEAVEIIKQTSSVVTKITAVEEKNKAKDIFPPQRINEKTLAMMCSQFSIILASGMPIVRAVSLISKQMEDKNLRNILKSVAEDVDAGFKMSKSFEMHGPQLPATFIETISAGEESGTLEQSFAKLQKYYEKSSKMKGKTISALTYPAFTILIAVIVVVVIMTVAVPVFSRTFVSLGIDLPLPTRIVISASNFFTDYGLFLAIGIVALIIAGKIFSKREKGRVFFANVMLSIPVIGKLTRMSSSALFASTMSTLLTSGIPVVKAVSITSKVMGNYILSLKLNDVSAGVEQGKRLAECLKICDELPELLIEMTGVGEETGSLEETLGVLSNFYNNEVETLSSRALALLEPAIICMLAVFVVFILLSVYLPMFSMYGGF